VPGNPVHVPDLKSILFFSAGAVLLTSNPDIVKAGMVKREAGGLIPLKANFLVKFIFLFLLLSTDEEIHLT
jgi:hypothetical protein